MNQILDYNPNSRPNKSGGSDNIVRVFAIILIIFALALIGVVGYGMISNKKEVTNVAEQKTNAKIEVNVDETQATISVTHDKVIQKLIYSWNEGSERTVKSTEKFMEETIDIPAGDNILHIKVIDENGIETTHDEEISSEQGIDILNPIIDLVPTEAKKLRITAKDETAMDFLTYRWNENDEETVYADENSKEIVVEIDILKGENDLTVIAVDGSSNTTNETKKFIGLTKPEITVTASADGSTIDIKAEHENGIKEVLFNFNGIDYNVDIGNQTPTTIEFPQALQAGMNNRIILTVKSVDGTESTFDANCAYGESGGVTSNETEPVDTQNTENETENEDEESTNTTTENTIENESENISQNEAEDTFSENEE